MSLPDEFEIWTPFGKVSVHRPTLPYLEPPKLDARKMDAFKHALASDLGSIIGLIPAVGDVASDVIEDLHWAELRKLLTPAEMKEYTKLDKMSPSSIALIQTFAKIR